MSKIYEEVSKEQLSLDQELTGGAFDRRGFIKTLGLGIIGSSLALSAHGEAPKKVEPPYFKEHYILDDKQTRRLLDKFGFYDMGLDKVISSDKKHTSQLMYTIDNPKFGPSPNLVELRVSIGKPYNIEGLVVISGTSTDSSEPKEFDFASIDLDKGVRKRYSRKKYRDPFRTHIEREDISKIDRELRNAVQGLFYFRKTAKEIYTPISDFEKVQEILHR